jgi:hypothetical protein
MEEQYPNLRLRLSDEHDGCIQNQWASMVA